MVDFRCDSEIEVLSATDAGRRRHWRDADKPDDLPGDLIPLMIPARRYAIFTHSGHISDIRRTVYTIWSKWLPEAGVTHVEGPDFERYDEKFDGETGTGDVEIWVPVQ